MIDGGRSGRVFKLDLISIVLTIECFKITNGYNASGGLYASAQGQTMDMTLINNMFINNDGRSGSVGAIYAASSQEVSMTLTVEKNIIRNNEAGTCTGAGIALSAHNDGETYAKITNSFIADNGKIDHGGGYTQRATRAM